MVKPISLMLAAAGTLAGLSMAAPAGASVSTASVYEAGRCMVHRDRRAASALIRALPLNGTRADFSALRGSNAQACIARAEGASAIVVRGAIAQALFLSDFRAFGRDPSSDVRPINLDLPVDAGPASGDRTTELYRWADCVVRSDSGGTERLLRSRVGSSEEGAAIAGLQAYMSACMPNGVRVSIRPSEVRSLFAQSAYFAMYRYWTGQLRAVNAERGG